MLLNTRLISHNPSQNSLESRTSGGYNHGGPDHTLGAGSWANSARGCDSTPMRLHCLHCNPTHLPYGRCEACEQ